MGVYSIGTGVGARQGVEDVSFIALDHHDRVSFQDVTYRRNRVTKDDLTEWL